jgi:hypothetical protein
MSNRKWLLMVYIFFQRNQKKENGLLLAPSTGKKKQKYKLSSNNP